MAWRDREWSGPAGRAEVWSGMESKQIAHAIMARVHHMIPGQAISAVIFAIEDELNKTPEEELMRDLKPPFNPLAVALFKAAAVSSDVAKAKKIAGDGFRGAEKEAGK